MNQTSNEQKNQANVCLRDGATALASGRIANAEKAFHAALAVIPGYAPANYNLGLIRLRQGNARDAEPYLSQAAQSMPSIKTYTALAECYEQLGQDRPAITCFQAILKKTPDNAKLWLRLALLLERTGKKKDAEIAYRRSLDIDPTQVSAAIKLGWIVWRKSPSEAILMLEETLSAIGKNLENRIKVLSVLLLFREWQTRIQDDLPPYHASSLDDLFFRNTSETLKELKKCATALLVRDQNDQWARMTEGLAEFASGNLEGAQQRFSVVGSATGNAMAASIRFDDAFFDELASVTDTELLNGLPAVETVQSDAFAKQNILYMSCNASYFDAFAKPLMRSLADCGEGSQVHIHLMDSSHAHTNSAVQFCEQLSGVNTALSVERPDFQGQDIMKARAYFHAIRFIRFFHHLQIYGKTLWLMDVDGLFNRNPDEIFAGIGTADISMRVRPGRLEPWNQFNACMVGVRPTEAALRYIQRVSAYIAHFYGTGELPWGIDQLAMYAAFTSLQKKALAPSLHFLNEKVLDYEYRDDGILWCSSGSTKFTALSRTEVENDPDAGPYDRAFARYSSMDSYA